MRVLGYFAVGYLVLTILVGFLASPGMFLIFFAVAVIVLVTGLRTGWRARALGPALRGGGAALLIFLTGWAGGLLITFRQEVFSESGYATRFTRATLPSTPPPPDDLELARAYEPLFIYSQGERWFPSSVVTYLRSAGVEASGETTAKHPSVERLADLCDTPCELTLGCDGFSDDDCVRDRAGPSVIYARVLRAGRSQRERRNFGRPLPFPSLTTIVQYWVFYRYNDWIAWWGGFRAWHEADWEAVTIGLSRSKPLFAAYASHCGGEWREWKHLAGASLRRDTAGSWIPEGNPARGPHPLAFVAEGSHAAYPDNLYRSPNFLSCRPGAGLKTASAVAGPTFGAGVRETMEQVEGRQDLLRVPEIKLVDDATNFLQFGGRWAPESATKLLPKTVRSDGPQTPSNQDLWIDPIWTIFCKPHWLPADRCPAGLRRLTKPRADASAAANGSAGLSSEKR